MCMFVGYKDQIAFVMFVHIKIVKVFLSNGQLHAF